MANANTSKLKITIKNPPLDVELKTKSSIIYLVGKNGAGKSRFIDGLRDSKGLIMTNPDSKSKRNIPFRYLDWGKFEYDFTKSMNQEFKEENKTLELSGQKEVSFFEKTSKGKVEIVEGKRIRKDEIFEQPIRNDIEFEGIEHFSLGTKKIHQMLNWKISESLGPPFYPTSYKQHQAQLQLLVIGLEEPENSLHPELQRELPKLLNTWILNQRVRQPILIVVSTHSPFVIKGASKYKNSQRVYGLEETGFIDLTGKDDTTIASDGVSGSQSLIVANKMLGAGIKDFFPNPIIMAENSIIELLNSISSNLEYSFNEFIVTPQGDGDVEERIGNIQQMIKILKKMQKSFPDRELFDFKIIIVVDDKAKEVELKDKFNNVGEFEIEVFGLGENQLEDIYPQNLIDEFVFSKHPKKKSWDKNVLINQYLTAELKLKGKDKGIFKKDMAQFVGKKITNESELNRDLESVSELFSKIDIK